MISLARQFLLHAALLAALLFPAAGAVCAAGTEAVVLGTDLPESSFTGKWLRRIYAEAFRRLGIPLEFAVYPLKRLSTMVDAGKLDGELLRAHGYAALHPQLVRVEESVLDVFIVLYAANPDLKLERLEDLSSRDWYADYRRGVGVCESLLTKALPREQVFDVTTTEQGLRKLLAGRSDVFCDFDLAVLAELYSQDYGDAGNVRKLFTLGNPTPLYPYLHGKKAALAPRLAAVLRQMKAEGLVQAYRAEAEKSMTTGTR